MHSSKGDTIKILSLSLAVIPCKCILRKYLILTTKTKFEINKLSHLITVIVNIAFLLGTTGMNRKKKNCWV